MEIGWCPKNFKPLQFLQEDKIQRILLFFPNQSGSKQTLFYYARNTEIIGNCLLSESWIIWPFVNFNFQTQNKFYVFRTKTLLWTIFVLPIGFVCFEWLVIEISEIELELTEYLLEIQSDGSDLIILSVLMFMQASSQQCLSQLTRYYDNWIQKMLEVSHVQAWSLSHHTPPPHPLWYDYHDGGYYMTIKLLCRGLYLERHTIEPNPAPKFSGHIFYSPIKEIIPKGGLLFRGGSYKGERPIYS